MCFTSWATSAPPEMQIFIKIFESRKVCFVFNVRSLQRQSKFSLPLFFFLFLIFPRSAGKELQHKHPEKISSLEPSPTTPMYTTTGHLESSSWTCRLLLNFQWCHTAPSHHENYVCIRHMKTSYCPEFFMKINSMTSKSLVRINNPTDSITQQLMNKNEPKDY